MNKNTIILSIVFLSSFSCKKQIDYYSYSTFSKSNNLNAIIEIPAGTNKKFEYVNHQFVIDKKDGKERVINFLPYVGNYGFIPSTYSNPTDGGDGDALDILVLSESAPTGSIIEVIPMAVLKLIDDGEIDYKVIAIPVNKRDQIINAQTLDQFNAGYPEVKKIIELWFLNYNKDDKAKIDGWGDEKEAIAEINKNRER